MKIVKCPECKRQYSMGYNAGYNKGMAEVASIIQYYEEKLNEKRIAR